MIPLPHLSRTTVGVLGLGISGLAAARALTASGVRVWAWDDNAEARRRAAEHPVVDLTDLHWADFTQISCLVLSPGIPHTHPVAHPVVVRARAASCPIIGDVDLLFHACPAATYAGITGTNGKSTTTALIGHILEAAGRRCEVGGNLGPPVLAMQPLDGDGVYVLEMSSYQLELTPSAAFSVAVLLNITPDHLARHGGFDGYVRAKSLIFEGLPEGATPVVGIDDDACRRLCDRLRADGRRVVAISAEGDAEAQVFTRDGILYDALDGGEPRRVMDLATVPALPGSHNGQNAAAAYAAARALDVDAATIVGAIGSFGGLAHRQERVAEINGVLYVNDSKATNPEAAAKALACYGAIYWIAGGRPKEGGLEALFPLAGRIRHAFLIGESEDAFAAALDGRMPVSRCATLDRAVNDARAAAERERVPGAVVLLSPACASFDQFRNFEERGAAFRALVEGWDR